MKKTSLTVFETLKDIQKQNNLDLNNARFAFGKLGKVFVFVNKTSEDEKNNEITFFVAEKNTLVKAGFITYGVGKGFWTNRQVNLHKIEVDETFRGNGLATYGLSFLTQLAQQRRIETIDGNYFPSTQSAKQTYFKNGFTIEKEYYDTRVVKSVNEFTTKNILKNTHTHNGFVVFNNHKTLYVDKYEQQETVQQS